MLNSAILNLCSLMLGVCLAAAASGGAAAAESPSGEAWALLIGCEQYEKAEKLRYIVNDVEAIADTLMTRAEYRRDRVKRLHDKADGRPDGDTIRKTVEEFLSKPAENDRLLVYFSGHGFRGDNGRLYLAPIECDPADPEATGLSVQWLREQMAACKARTKLVILDACHAGSERSVAGRDAVNSETVVEEFRGLDRVITIASSSATQPSRLDPDHRHSLFTYWLIEGLKGSADSSRDGNVNIDELFDFVHRQVSDRSERLGGRQTPVRIYRAGVDGVPLVARLVPQPLDTVLDDIAGRLADRIVDKKIHRVGVIEFVDATEAGKLMGVGYVALGKYCAEGIQRRLVEMAGDRFGVIDRHRLLEAIRTTRLTPENLADAGRMEALSRSAGGMPAVVLGSLRGNVKLDGRDAGKAIVQIEARLTETEGSDDQGTAAGVAYLSESEWAMTGASVDVDPEDRNTRPAVFAASHPPALENISSQVSVVERLEIKARNGHHPLSGSEFRFPVKIMVQQGKRLVERPGREIKGEWVVNLATGEEYAVRVGNRFGEPVFMRLLVDGLNTQIEREELKGVSTMVAGMRVNLDRAEPWVLDPSLPGVFKEKGVPWWDLKGFCKTSDSTSETEFGRFTVVDAAASLAERRGFSEQIGTITAAFYKAIKKVNKDDESGSGTRDVGTDSDDAGTDSGRTYREEVQQVYGYDLGPMLATVTIRYVAQDK